MKRFAMSVFESILLRVGGALVVAVTITSQAFAAPGRVPHLSGVPQLQAATPVRQAVAVRKESSVSDVELGEKGLLVGQVVNGQGGPIIKAQVTLYGSTGEPVIAVTNEQGAFAYQGVRNGVYYLRAGDDLKVCRAWGQKTAPPAASQGVLLVSSNKTIRGQMGPPPAANNFVRKSKRILTNPIAVTGIVATAVAVPVAIHNANDDGPATP